MTWGPWFLVLTVCCSAGRAFAVAESATPSSDWPMHGHDERHTNNNPGMAADFVPPLYPRWVTILRPPGVGGPPPFPQGKPVVGDDKIFIPVSHGALLFRLDAATGVREAVFQRPQNTWPGVHPAGAPVFFRTSVGGIPRGAVAWGVGSDSLTRSDRGLMAIASNFQDPPLGGVSDLIFSNAGTVTPYDVAQVSTCAPVVFDGQIVATDNENRNFTMDTSGVVRWMRPAVGVSPSIFLTSPAAFKSPYGALGWAFFRVETCDLYSGVRRWVTGGARVPSTDGSGRVFLPVPDQRLLSTRGDFHGNLLWVVAVPGFGSSDMVALGDGKVVWNTGEHLHAFNAATGATIWSTPVFMPFSCPVIGNGYVWEAGMGSIVALRFSDGVMTWTQTGIPSTIAIAPILTPAGGGELIVTIGPAMLAFGPHYLPLGVTLPPEIKARDADLLLSWVPPIPLVDRPQPVAYVIVRQCVQGVAPVGDAAVQYALFNLATNQVMLPLPAAGIVQPIPATPQEVVIRLPDHLSTPPCMDVFTQPISGPVQLTDAGVNSGVNYIYRVFMMYEDGSLSPPSAPTSPTKVLHVLNGEPGAILPGGDWLEAEHDVEHTGWNPREHLSYTAGVDGLYNSVQDGFRPAWTFSGLPSGSCTTFTQPVASLGRVYVGGADGRLYALNAQTGSVLWWVSTGAPIRFPPAIQQSRASIWQPGGALEPVDNEGIFAVSDSGNSYSITIGPSDAVPRSVERTPLGGVPVCAPNSFGQVLYRNGAGYVCSSAGALPVQVAFTTDGFIGPNNSLFLWGAGSGNLLASGFGIVPLRSGPRLNVKSVRPSRNVYRSGFEELVAGYQDGWYALVKDPSTPLWAPIWESPQGSGGTVGGIIESWGQDPDRYYGIPTPPFSDSVLEAFSMTGSLGYDIRRINFDGSTTTRPGCASGGGAGIIMPVAVELDLTQPFLATDPITGQIVRTYPDLSGDTAVSMQSGSTDSAAKTTVTMSTSQANVLTMELLSPISCSQLPAPTKLITGTTDALGIFTVGAEYPFTDGIFSRAFRFSGGPVVVGEAWTGVFAPRATGEFTVDTGQLVRVNLVWTPTPWPAAVGYKVYRMDVGITPNEFHEIATVSGRDSRTYTDDASGTQARILRYMVRATKDLRPQVTFDDLGAPSLTVRPEAGIVDRVDTSFVPDVGFEEDTFLLTGRVTINQTLVGTSALTLPISTQFSLTSSLGDTIVSRSVNPEVMPGTMPTEDQVITDVQHPVPGIPVHLVFNTSGRGLVRTSLTDPGSTTFDQILITDQEGKFQVLFQPVVGSTAAGPYLIKYFGEIAGNFTASGQILHFDNAFVDTRVIPNIASVVAASSGYTFTPSWGMNVSAFIRQGFGTLTGPNMFGGVTPLSGQTSESSIQAAVTQADFFGSPFLPCQGLACSVPVNTMSGAMLMEVPDLVLPSRGAPLGWGRVYTNFRVGFSPLGQGWHGGYHQRLERLADGSYRHFGWTGDIRLYRNTPGGFVSPPGSFDTLTQQGAKVVLRSRAGEILEFDADLRLVRTADRRGQSQRLAYSAGQLASITDDVGQSIRLAYDGQGRVREVTDSTGRAVQYEYNTLDQLIKVTRPGGEVATYTYGTDGLLAAWSEPKLPMGAKQGAVKYDGAKRVTEVFDGEGQRKHTLGYTRSEDGTSRTTISETCCGPRVDVYDRRGILTEQIDAKGQHTFMEFDAQIRLVSRTDRNGHATLITYNAKGLPATITDALGNLTTFEYEPKHGFLASVTDALNRRTTFQYDGIGNCVGTTDAAGGVWSQAFDGFGQLRSRTDALGHTANLDYNQVGDLVGMADALSRTTALEFDIRHRLTRRTDAKGRDTDFVYDDRDLRTVVQYTDGATTRTEHDAFRRTVLVTDALNHTTLSVYDQDDRLVRMVDPRSAITQYRYDVQGNLLGVTDANGHETAYTYNALNRLTKITDPLGKTQQYSYDPEGNRIERVDGNGVHTTFSHDALNRLLSRNFSGGTKEEFQYNAVGQVVLTRNPTVEQTYARDALNRVTDHRYVTFNKTLRYGWDAVGNRTRLTYSDGNVMSYSFDEANQLVQATDTKAGTLTLAYDLTGHRTSLAFPNGLTTTYNYDVRDRVLGIVTTGEKGQGAAVQAPDFLYGYDPVGNRTFMDRSDEGKTEYSYDPSDQLTKAAFPNGGFQEFAYDPSGNRLSLREQEDGQLHTTKYEYDSGNELLRLVRNFRDGGAGPNALMAGPGAPTSGTVFVTTFSYDGNGSRTVKAPDDVPATTYAWDAQERLLAVADGGKMIETAGYDVYARRTTLVEGSAPTRFLYDGAQVNNRYYEELPAKGGASARQLWLGGSLVGVISQGDAIYFMADAIGSVGAKVGSGSTVLQRNFYKPFGEVKAVMAHLPLGNRAGHLGGQGVQEVVGSRRTYMWRRYFDPQIGHFISTDPLLKSISIRSATREFRQYGYAKNNPIRYVDPKGLATVTIVWPCLPAGIIPNFYNPTTSHGCDLSGDKCSENCAKIEDPEDKIHCTEGCDAAVDACKERVGG